MEKLAAIVARVLDIEPGKVTDELSRENAESWDSFNHLLLISEIEKDLGIQFSMEEVEAIHTSRQLKETVRNKT
jgi:acyl carrier protein